jgi:hypothetical protein
VVYVLDILFSWIMNIYFTNYYIVRILMRLNMNYVGPTYVVLV